MPDVLSFMKRPNTIAAYSQAFNSFQKWANEFDELQTYPATEYTVGVYILHMIKEKKSTSSIKQFTASMSWLHKLGGYINPIQTDIVQTLLDSALRMNTAPVKHKTPVTKDMLLALHETMVEGQLYENLHNLRDFTYILLSFTGFMRFDEAAHIRRSDLHLFFDSMTIVIPRSKTDPMEEGNYVYISRSSTSLCALTWLARYLVAAGISNNSNDYIFRALVYNKEDQVWKLRSSNRPLSHSTLSDMFRNRIAAAGFDHTSFSLHSLRAGGVTLAAEQGVDEKLYKSHGRWASDVVRAYVTETEQNKLSVTTDMDL